MPRSFEKKSRNWVKKKSELRGRPPLFTYFPLPLQAGISVTLSDSLLLTTLTLSITGSVNNRQVKLAVTVGITHSMLVRTALRSICTYSVPPKLPLTVSVFHHFYPTLKPTQERMTFLENLPESSQNNSAPPSQYYRFIPDNSYFALTIGFQLLPH